MKPIVIKPFVYDPNKAQSRRDESNEVEKATSDALITTTVTRRELLWALDKVLRISEDYDVARHIRQGEVDLDDDEYEDEGEAYRKNDYEDEYTVSKSKRHTAASAFLDALDIIQDALNEGL